MVSMLYLTVFFLSVILLCRLLIRNKSIDSKLVFLAITIMLNNFGRYLVSVSQTVEMATCANKILYFGACFAPVMLALIMCDLCKIKIPTIVKYICGAIPTLVYLLVLSIGKSEIYYKSIDIAFADGYTYLVKEYGPLHIFFPILMIICFLTYVFIVVYAIVRKKNVSVRILILMCFIGLSVGLTYLFQSVFFHSTVEWISMSYLMAIILLTYLVERVNMFDMSANIANSIEKTNENGYIVFDNKNRYIDSNAFVQEVFPEILSWKNDAMPPQTDSMLYNDIVKYGIGRQKDNLDNERRKTITIDNHWYEINVRDVLFSRRKVGYLLEMVDRTAENQYLTAIEKYNSELEKEVEKKTESIVHVKDMMVLGMAAMVESRDSSTGGHIRRTSMVVDIFAGKLILYEQQLGLTGEFLKKVSKAAPMHDLGKIAVSDSILRKQGKFTDEEYAEMKKHTAAGGKIVDEILNGVEDEDFVEISRNVANFHHEKYDGTGYPTGMKGEDIPIEARIMALADVFDALVSKRCYKDAFSYDRAFGIIKESIGSHFDPKLGEVFLECRSELEELYNGFE